MPPAARFASGALLCPPSAAARGARERPLRRTTYGPTQRSKTSFMTYSVISSPLMYTIGAATSFVPPEEAAADAGGSGGGARTRGRGLVRLLPAVFVGFRNSVQGSGARLALATGAFGAQWRTPHTPCGFASPTLRVGAVNTPPWRALWVRPPAAAADRTRRRAAPRPRRETHALAQGVSLRCPDAAGSRAVGRGGRPRGGPEALQVRHAGGCCRGWRLT